MEELKSLQSDLQSKVLKERVVYENFEKMVFNEIETLTKKNIEAL